MPNKIEGLVWLFVYGTDQINLAYQGSTNWGEMLGTLLSYKWHAQPNLISGKGDRDGNQYAQPNSMSSHILKIMERTKFNLLFGSFQGIGPILLISMLCYQPLKMGHLKKTWGLSNFLIRQALACKLFQNLSSLVNSKMVRYRSRISRLPIKKNPLLGFV